MIKKFFIIFSGLLLIYMIWPGPGRIDQFPVLPFSEKSKLEGDTVQIPNVSAYFSNNFRDLVIPFYAGFYQNLTKFPFPPLRLNYPPEVSWIAIKKHTDSTYLEEFIYPLRDSLYVNGFEPFEENGEPKYWGATKFEIGKNSWFTKTTLRFYPSSIWTRFLTWFGITLSLFLIYRLGKNILLR
ncbi:MAG: hypothetical protein Q8Q91_00505 [Candidatus Daviesbacteria bacterium]|nr:hypothetical protein [Candidatus Daviesbacteria bacterium]